MPRRAWSICPRCPEPVPTPGPCPACSRKADRDRRPDGNPYTSHGHRVTFREGVLARHPICVCIGECGHHGHRCGQRATVADHHPIERRDLIAQGLDPNDPARGRGLCFSCHSAITALTNPAGWNAHN